jgi:TPR repeat protein
LNQSEISSNNSLYKTWPEIKDLTGTSFENEQVYQKLFKNRFQTKYITFGRNGLKLVANTFLVILFYLIYIDPLNNFIRNLPLESFVERQQSAKVAKVISCLYDSYKVNTAKISVDSKELRQLQFSEIDDVKLKCQEIAEKGEALGYLGLANLALDPLEKEQYLIQGAKLDETDGFDQLISFYSEIAYLNFEIMGKPTLQNCTIQKDPFCLRIMGVMHYKIGLNALINEQINDYQTPIAEITNLDIDKGLNYMRQAAELGDSSSAVDLSTILRSRSKPVEFSQLIQEQANNGNIHSARWMYSQAVLRGDLTSQELWTRKLNELDDNILTVLQISLEYGNENYDKAYELASECLKYLEPMCYSIYATILTGKVGVSNFEVEKYYLLAALMGDTVAINSVAKLKSDQGLINEAEEWYWKGITQTDSDSYIGLGDLSIKQSNNFRACFNFKKAAVLINQRLSSNEIDSYLKGNFESGISGTAELFDDSQNLEFDKFRKLNAKIDNFCTI